MGSAGHCEVSELVSLSRTLVVEVLKEGVVGWCCCWLVVKTG